MLTLKILIALVAIFIAYQDFKERLINLWLIIVFGAILLAYGVAYFGFLSLINNLLFSLFIACFTALIFLTYFFIIRKQGFSEVKKQIGSADVIMLLMPAFVFTPGNFLIFITVSAILSVIYYIISISFFMGGKAHFIPLAGLISIFIPIEIQFEFCNKLVSSFQ